jgi:hypothetical protein
MLSVACILDTGSNTKEAYVHVDVTALDVSKSRIRQPYIVHCGAQETQNTWCHRPWQRCKTLVEPSTHPRAYLRPCLCKPVSCRVAPRQERPEFLRHHADTTPTNDSLRPRNTEMLTPRHGQRRKEAANSPSPVERNLVSRLWAGSRSAAMKSHETSLLSPFCETPLFISRH